jgi:ABC-type polar amino acid transport system ATPase subunit
VHEFEDWVRLAVIPRDDDARNLRWMGATTAPGWRFTIVLVTHNMDQARRVADKTAFVYVDTRQGRTGYLVESGDTAEIFDNPRDPLTKDYIAGQFS